MRSVVLRDRAGTYQTCLRLSGRRFLDLNQETRKWRSAAPDDVTVRDLLSHTAGLAQPRSEPAQVRYCNAGYWMLGSHLTSGPIQRMGPRLSPK